MRLVKEYGLWLIEDNCDSLGSRYNDQLTGTFGHLASHSFYPAHHITMGEGGCVVTRDEVWGELSALFGIGGGTVIARVVKITPAVNDLASNLEHSRMVMIINMYNSHIGYNLKVTDMQAAIGVAQLKKLPSFIEKRKQNFAALTNILNSYEDRLILPKALPNSDPAWFAFPITVRENAGFTRNELTEFLEANRIETRNLF